MNKREIYFGGQTGIPKEMTTFFHVENLEPGSRKKIELLHNNKSYAAEISMDITTKTKLSWGKN